MNWLSQNWVWVVLATAVIAYLLHRNRTQHGGSLDSMTGGISHTSGLGDHHDHDRGADTSGSPGYRTAQADTPGAEIDPVTGTSVQISAALTSIYGGRVYYFASSENRARFEAAPEQFVRGEGGQQLPAQDSAPAARPHRRHGC